MPNTLAHLGVQGLLTRAILGKIDLKIVYIGCVLPDLPWIFQRLVKLAYPGFDLYDLRLYTVVQASLFFCVLLSAIIALFLREFGKAFAVLTLSSFLHLLLDALQKKWANGVHFFVPFNWQLTNFGLFWPESLPTYGLTIFGLIVILTSWPQVAKVPFHLARLSYVRAIIFGLCSASYFLIPLYLLPFPEAADNHFVKTLRTVENRPGTYIEFDRGYYFQRNSAGILQAITEEEIEVENMELVGPAVVSVRGTFLTKDRVRVTNYHVHSPTFRDGATYIGLILVLALCIHTVVNQFRNNQPAQ